MKVEMASRGLGRKARLNLDFTIYLVLYRGGLFSPKSFYPLYLGFQTIFFVLQYGSSDTNRRENRNS